MFLAHVQELYCCKLIQPGQKGSQMQLQHLVPPPQTDEDLCLSKSKVPLCQALLHSLSHWWWKSNANNQGINTIHAWVCNDVWASCSLFEITCGKIEGAIIQHWQSCITQSCLQLRLGSFTYLEHYVKTSFKLSLQQHNADYKGVCLHDPRYGKWQIFATRNRLCCSSIQPEQG